MPGNAGEHVRGDDQHRNLKALQFTPPVVKSGTAWAACSLANFFPPMPSTRTTKIRPLCILIVEDHAETLNTLRRLLERDGHEVRTAATFRDALLTADEWAFDALLSDIALADGDGWDLLQRLRERRDFAAVAMSGYGSEPERQRSVEAGFSCHIVKPFDPAVLREELRKIGEAVSERRERKRKTRVPKAG
jgi:CheY-like chemotaxis protein